MDDLITFAEAVLDDKLETVDLLKNDNGIIIFPESLTGFSRFTHMYNLYDRELIKHTIGDSGAKKIAKIITPNLQLQELRLDHCNLTYFGTKYICEALARNLHVKKVSFAHNKNVDDAAAREIAKLLTANPRIQEIYVFDCDITSVGAKYICDALVDNKTVNHFSISRNAIGDAGAKEIVKLLKVNTTIEFLGIEKCGFTPVGDNEIFSAIVSSPYFTLVDGAFSYNHAGSIDSICRRNEELKEMLKNPSSAFLPLSDFSTDEHIRCYSCRLWGLNDIFRFRSQDDKWKVLKSMFIANTEITQEFVDKWFCAENAKLFETLETVVFVKCGMKFSLNLLLLFKNAKTFNIIS
jgi:Ran GTPase-activating protein (RanGAP) involved in mRNA processing and transport